jgi:hypothetical protein
MKDPKKIRLTNEALREISKSTEKMKEYQEDSINIINNIANNYIESQKELFTYFSDSYNGNNTNKGEKLSSNVVAKLLLS